VLKLARQVALKDLQIGNIGGNFWSLFKNDENFAPDWSHVKKAPLWTDEARFGRTVWTWLCEGVEDWTVASAGRMMDKQGMIYKVQVDVGDKKENLHWGDVSALVRTRRIVDLIYIDVKDGHNAMDDDVIAAISNGAKQETGIRVLLVGPRKDVEYLLTGAFAKLSEASAPLGGYRLRKVALFLPRDDVLGAREAGYSGVERLAALFSPTPLKTCTPYVVSLMPWTPVIVAHLVQVFDLSGDALMTGDVPSGSFT
jgi:hypothetical protein